MAGFPVYPTGPSLLFYMASRIVDSFQEAVATLFHIMELISIGSAAMDLIRIGAKLGRTKKPDWFLWLYKFQTSFNCIVY
jgi:hypothetical protein